MAGFIPTIHVFAESQQKNVYGRDKPGHDESAYFRKQKSYRECDRIFNQPPRLGRTPDNGT